MSSSAGRLVKPSPTVPIVPNEFDIILISSDGVKFGMVKAELARKSEFFRKMFDAASKPDQPESVPLAESSKVLQVVLATCMGDKYGAPKIPCDQRDSDFWRMAKCFNKYGMTEALSSIANDLSYSGRPDRYYRFSFHFHRDSLEDSILEVVDARPGTKAAGEYDQVAKRYGVQDDGKLVQLLKKREVVLRDKQVALLGAVAAALQNAGSKKTAIYKLGVALEGWADAQDGTISKARKEFWSYRFDADDNFLPWDKLKQAFTSLPTDLE